jgi:hypothetical protein
MFQRFRSPPPIPLPIAPPPPEAIAKGSFGMEEDDCTPVYPSDEEAIDLTQNCGERLVELIESLEAAEVELANAGQEARGPLV